MPRFDSRVRVSDSPRVIRTSGVPTGFLELSSGYFIYMLIANGRVVFVSAGFDPWEVAAKLKRKFKADRIVYQASTVDGAPNKISDLIEKYSPQYNSSSTHHKLSELDAILGNSNACAA